MRVFHAEKDRAAYNNALAQYLRYVSAEEICTSENLNIAIVKSKILKDKHIDRFKDYAFDLFSILATVILLINMTYKYYRVPCVRNCKKELTDFIKIS